MSTFSIGLRRAGQAMVPGQSAAPGRIAVARISLGLASPSAHRNRIVSHRTAVAGVFDAGNPDLAAGTIRSSGIFSEGIFTFSDLAGAGSDPGGVGVRGNDGHADRAEAAGLSAAVDAPRDAEEVRGRLPCPCWDPGRNIAFRPDRAGHDDLSIL